MTKAYLILAAIGLVVTINALRPFPGTWLSVPSFFGGWLYAELAPHNLVIVVVVSAVFVASGAVHGVQGWLAVAFSAASAAGLCVLIVQAQRAREVVERALVEGLGAGYVDAIRPDRAAHHDLRVPWRQLILPFWMRHPDVVRIRNVPYGPAGRRNALDVYRHRSAPTGAPILLQIHGGGWTMGNKEQQGRPVMLHLASRGWVCFAINYRLSPRSPWPAHIVDVKRAIAWIREHAHTYGGDPDFIMVTGGSAGGHLSALAALTANDPAFQPGFEPADTSVAAAVPYYGVYDFTNEVGLSAARGRTRFLERVVFRAKLSEDRTAFEDASPLFRLRADAPPFFVIHGAHDSLVPVPEARLFVERLRQTSDAPVVYAELPGAQHAFDVFPSIRTAHVIRGMERFADWVYCAYLDRCEVPAPQDDDAAPLAHG